MLSNRINIQWRLILPVLTLTLVMLVSAVVAVPQIISNAAHRDGVEMATKTVNIFRTLREYYTNNIVNEVIQNGQFSAGVNHRENAKKIPLPATMIHDLSAILEKQGTHVELYSIYPFSNRSSRELDSFQQLAWTQLTADASATPSLLRGEKGAEEVRFAVADVMVSETCINCHNQHPDSPKTDWKLGDVRGVLEVRVDMSSSMSHWRGISSFVTYALLLGGVILGAMLIYEARRSNLVGLLSNLDSERHRRIEAEQANEDLVEDILNRMPIGVAITRIHDGKIVFTNEHHAHLFHLSVEDMYSQHYPSFYSDPMQRREIVSRFRSEGLIRAEEVHFQRADGTHFWGHLSLQSIDFEEEEMFLAVVYDITAIKEAQDELHYSRQRFHDFADSTSDWYWEMDKNLRFVYLSSRFYEVSGWTPEDMIGIPREDYIKRFNITTGREKLKAYMDALQQRKPFRNFEYGSETRDGERFIVQMSGKPVFDDEGLFLGYRGTGSDVTTLAIAQEQLNESAKLVSLGGMVAGIAHEINTPVGIGVTAVSHLDNLINDIKQVLESGKLGKNRFAEFLEDCTEAAAIINSNLSKAAKLVNSFKLVAVDRTNDEMRNIYIKSYIEDVLLSLRPRLKKTRINVSVTCEDGWQMMTYPGALSQVISNLVINSLIHGFPEDQEGGITIEVVPIDNGYILTYRDTGKGMSAENRERVFDPFFTTRRGDGGSGLGLHIVHNVITQVLKGRITLSTEPGQGVEFAVTLPDLIDGDKA